MTLAEVGASLLPFTSVPADMTTVRRLTPLLAALAIEGCAPTPAPPSTAAPATRSVSLPTAAAGAAGEIPANSTFANPLDLDYRFMPTLPSRRQAADPLIVIHDDEYYLFASRSGGYWRSPDMRAWTLVIPTGLPIEDYAPAVITLGGRLYYTAHKSQAMFTTDDPGRGQWRKVADLASYPDPAFFLDDDGRLYLYFGAALNGSISVVELDPGTFGVLGGPFVLMSANHAEHGWERSGPGNLGAVMTEGFRIAPYIEGPWMTKHDGTYYLQYSAPGTVWKTYADGVYTSTSPTSGFTYQAYSPFSYKPGGFIGSAGHGAMFRDKQGNWWRIVTMIISVAEKFERRLGIFPAGFDEDGMIRTDTYLGDYPQFLPGVKVSPLDANRTGWMLLSSGMPASASSSHEEHPVTLAFDEDIRTQWSAASGRPGEWLRVDLGATSTIRAIQANFGEKDTKSLGRDSSTYHQYTIETSHDGEAWEMLIDRSASTTDEPHDYVQLDRPRQARHVRITNVHAAAGGRFAVRDLRIFGGSPAPLPAAVASFTVRRNPADDRAAVVEWQQVPGARGYVIRSGIAPDKLYANHQVGDVASLRLESLNVGVTYFFTIDSFNERGVVRGSRVVRLPPAAGLPR